jgi:hypothetical protein
MSKIHFSLFCVEPHAHKGEWLFEEHGQGMNILDPNDALVGWFPHASADDRFVLPSFWRSVKNIGCHLNDGTTAWFTPDRRDVARVRDYLDEAIVSRGPAAVRGLWLRGGLFLLAGLGALFGSCVGFAVLKMIFEVERKPAYYGIAALGLYGLGQTALAIATLFRAARLNRVLSRRGTG